MSTAYRIDEVAELITRINESATAPAAWPATLSTIAATFGSATASLLVADGVTREARFRDVGADPIATESYNNYYGGVDFVAATIETSPVGAIRTGSELIDPNKHTEFYTDWIQPCGLDDGLFTRLNTSCDVPSWLVLAAPKLYTPFSTPKRVALLRLLIPHFQNAIRTQTMLGNSRNDRALALELLELLPHAVVILGKNGVVQHQNSAASLLFTRDDGLSIGRYGTLTASSARCNTELTQLIRASTGPVRTGGYTTIERRSKGPRYLVHLIPLPSTFDDAVTLAAIVDPDRAASTSQDHLRAMYNLTHAEVVVAERVQAGIGLNAVASELGVSLATVRTHLQHIFQKTGTHRQAELVRVLSRIRLLVRSAT